MGELDEIDFGPDTDTIRRWLAKRATYAGDRGDPVQGGKHRADPPATVDHRSLSVPNARDTGQQVLEALVAPEPPAVARRQSHDEPVVEPVVEQAPEAPPKPRERSPYASTPEHEEELIASRSTNAVFEPRKTGRRVVTAAFAVVAILLAAAAYAAYQERSPASYGLAALMGGLAIVVWGVRASTTLTELAVIRGQLEMIRDGRFEVIDLASPYTPVYVEGTPGRRDWRVLIERHDEPLLVLDRSVVDPVLFTRVLERIRPDLQP